MQYLPILFNALIILTFTIALVIWELELKNRKFPWLPIVFSTPFWVLVSLQAMIVMGFLVGLVATGRARYASYFDAVWVSLGGLSLLKTLPAPSGDGAQRLWGLADWIFGKFYRQLRVRIARQSDLFKAYLKDRYTTSPDAFMTDVETFIGLNEASDAAASEQTRVRTQFNSLPDAQSKIAFLADYTGPRTTKTEWVDLVVA